MSNVSFQDQYGFIYSWPKETARAFAQNILPRQNSKIQEWKHYFSLIKGIENFRRNSSSKKMVRNGIPDDYRPFIWLRLTNCETWIRQNPALYRSLLHSTAAIPQKIHNIHDADIPRTFPNNLKVSPQSLRNVLQAFAIFKPDIGYCQGLNYIAAILMTVVGEENAFYLLVKIVEDYLPTDYFCNEMKDFKIDLKVMHMLIEERIPDLGKLARQLKYEWLFISSSWILILFSSSFPISTVLRIWDSIFYEDQKVCFRIAIGFLRLIEPQLILEKSLKGFTDKINLFQSTLIDDDELMQSAFEIRAFSRKKIIGYRNICKDNFDSQNPEEKKSLISFVNSFVTF